MLQDVYKSPAGNSTDLTGFALLKGTSCCTSTVKRGRGVRFGEACARTAYCSITVLTNDKDRNEIWNDTNGSTEIVVKGTDSFRFERYQLTVISILPAGNSTAGTDFDWIRGTSCSTSMVKQGCGARSITWLAILPSSGCYGKVFLIRMFCLGRCMYIEAGIRTVTTSYDDSNSTYPPHLSTQSFQRPRILAQPIDLSVLGAIFFLFESRCCDRQNRIRK